MLAIWLGGGQFSRKFAAFRLVADGTEDGAEQAGACLERDALLFLKDDYRLVELLPLLEPSLVWFAARVAVEVFATVRGPGTA